MPAPAPESPIDVVDRQNRPIDTIERGQVLAQGKNFRVSHVWVFCEGRLLLQQLGHRRERHPLLWGSSVAGYLHAGESHDEAARRRLGEELGLRQASLEPCTLTEMQDRRSTKFIALYTTRISRPDLVRNAEPGHIEDLRFWTKGEVDTTLAAKATIFTQTFQHLYGVFDSWPTPVGH